MEQHREKTTTTAELRNVLFKKGFACAGTRPAVERLREAAEKEKAMQVASLAFDGVDETHL